MKPMIDMRVKLRLRKMCSGMIGSAALVCTKTKPTSAATPMPMSSMIPAEPQAYSLPPQVVTSTMDGDADGQQPGAQVVDLPLDPLLRQVQYGADRRGARRRRAAG